MIYVVSGYMRTGTSMMMQALTAGGLKAVFEETRNDIVTARYSDKHYHPNQQGIYELHLRTMLKLFQEPALIEGKLVKCLSGGIVHLGAWKWKLVFMERSYEEIRQSCLAFFGGANQVGTEDDFKKRMKFAQDLMDVRSDMEWIKLQYRDVVANPRKTFQLLKDQGWPIDVSKAAEIPRKSKVRYRFENLQVGIV